MDWTDTTFYPQDLYGNVLGFLGGVANTATSTLSAAETTLGTGLQQTEQTAVEVATGAAGAASAGVQQGLSTVGSIGAGALAAGGGALSAIEALPSESVQLAQQVQTVAQQQVVAVQQQAAAALNLAGQGGAALESGLAAAGAAGATSTVAVLRMAQNQVAATSTGAVAAENAIQSGAASALSILSSGLPKAAATVGALTALNPVVGVAAGVETLLAGTNVTNTVTNAVTAPVTGALSITTPVLGAVVNTQLEALGQATSFLGGAVKTAGSAATTIVAGATSELAGVATAGAETENAVPVFQAISNAGVETVNVAKNILAGEPAFQGITTGTVVTPASGISKSNVVAVGLSNAAAAAKTLPGVDFNLFETIVGPNANPVVLAGSQILDFTLQHPLTTTLVVAGTVLTGGAALDLLAPGEEAATTLTVEEATTIANPNELGGLEEDLGTSQVSDSVPEPTYGDATDTSACV